MTAQGLLQLALYLAVLLALAWPLGVYVALWLGRLWVWGVLPALVYPLARVLRLKTLGPVLIAAATGELFVLTISFFAAGVDGLPLRPAELLVELGSLGLGLFLSSRAIAAAQRNGS